MKCVDNAFGFLLKGAIVTTVDDFREKAEAAIGQAKPLVAAAVIGKAAAEAAGVTPEDVQAGAELVAEAVEGAISQAAADVASMTPEDLAAGAELAANAVASAIDKAAADAASITPEDIAAGAELVAEAVADAINKAAGTQQ